MIQSCRWLSGHLYGGQDDMELPLVSLSLAGVLATFFPLLVGEAILKASGERYEVPFFVLGARGLLACLMLAFGVSLPSPVKNTTEMRHPKIQRPGSTVHLSSRRLSQ